MFWGGGITQVLNISNQQISEGLCKHTVKTKKAINQTTQNDIQLSIGENIYPHLGTKCYVCRLVRQLRLTYLTLLKAGMHTLYLKPCVISFTMHWFRLESSGNKQVMMNAKSNCQVSVRVLDINARPYQICKEFF